MKIPGIPTITLFFVLCLPLCASAQTTAERVFSATEYRPAVPVSIEIKVTAVPGPVTVVEMPPAGWAIDSVRVPGQVSGGVITWDLTDFNGSKTLRYRVLPPSGTIGSVFFWGKVGHQEITGMSTLIQAVFQLKPLGIFQDHLDIGDFIPPGNATYNAVTGEYQVAAGGTGWAVYHLAYVELRGDFSLKAKIRSEDRGGSLQGGADAGLIVRDTLEADPTMDRMPFFGTGFRIDDKVEALWKNAPDMTFGWNVAVFTFPKGRGSVQELLRLGSTVSMYYIDPTNGRWVLHESQEIELTDPVYAGLWASSFAPEGVTVGYFTDVELDLEPSGPPTSAVEDWQLCR